MSGGVAPGGVELNPHRLRRERPSLGLPRGFVQKGYTKGQRNLFEPCFCCCVVVCCCVLLCVNVVVCGGGGGGGGVCAGGGVGFKVSF